MVDASNGTTLPGAAPRRRRTGTRVFVAVVVVIVVLAILAVIAELVVRRVADADAEKRIDSSLPAGTTGSVDVSIHGFSVILQLLHGSLDDVSLTSHDLVVQKVPVTFSATADDVPLAEGKTTGPITAKLTVDQNGLNESKLLQKASGSIALGTGSFSYDSSISILGLKLQYKVTATPTIASGGKAITLTPTNAAIRSSNSSIDVSSLLSFLKTQPPTICIASSLPTSARLTGLEVAPGTATFDLRSTGLPLDDSALSKTGTC
ncbi:hypothetical protein AX769_14745 [Frondihabitans sp. PAMC 28766]|uniref:LmeA family phospholipid-binding protein n=1 Tax=Frondihabitans sp. PAMC 28766 TaxID=1795630 RepID=UPI00078B25AD|nr:DUF2993 domain-containing protein [Frondihabitans sp. PAMC 28766]AMM21164.1 hypothetical protein AX769_14745 [Frondihabitans sp. PAMC 28766]